MVYFKFSVESSSFIVNNVKTKKIKVDTDQFVICLVLLERPSVKLVAFHPRTVKRIVTALMPSLLFRCFSLFSASFKNSSPREKVGKLSSF